MREDPKAIPFAAFESGMFRMERMNQRLAIALCVSLAVNVAVLVFVRK